MNQRMSREVVRHFQTLFGGGAAGGLSDAQLLARFARRRDESAFAALVERHGPMVLGVCRRVLADPHDAEDAFQATFLVLVRKAGSIGDRALLGNWLYGVAYRTALKARTSTVRRRARERRVMAMSRPDAHEAEPELDLEAVLDEELAALPEKYRALVVLCELEGVSRREAARRLDLAEGTVSSRLARARGLLRERLTRRGLALTAPAVAAALSRDAAAALPAALAESTVRAAIGFAAGPTAVAGVVSASVAALTQGVLTTMFLTKLKLVAATTVMAGLVTTGLYVQAQQPPPPADVASVPGPPGSDRMEALEKKLDRLLQVLERTTPGFDMPYLPPGKAKANEPAPAGATFAAPTHPSNAAYHLDRGQPGQEGAIAVPTPVSGGVTTDTPTDSSVRIQRLEKRVDEMEARLNQVMAHLKALDSQVAERRETLERRRNDLRGAETK